MTVPSVVLRDPASGCEAEVLIGLGFNCFRFVGLADGHRVDVLWSEEDFATGQKRPSGSGIPILFPFPGRIQGTRFIWEGRDYPLPEGDGRGNAIHGFVLSRPWRIVQQSDTRVVGHFQASMDDPSLGSQWPADFRITATYELEAHSLRCDYLLENPDRRPLPFGFGVHPYFRVPLVAGSAADDCRVELPVSTAWELADMNATGKVQALENVRAFRAGLRFADMHLDNVFGGLEFDDGVCHARIEDPATGRMVRMSFSRAFRECVVYNPPHREAVCIEPYTCVPDCFRLAREGIDGGLRVLAPGESFGATVTIEVA
jgi:aldose 1-epimerase